MESYIIASVLTADRTSQWLVHLIIGYCCYNLQCFCGNDVLRWAKKRGIEQRRDEERHSSWNTGTGAMIRACVVGVAQMKTYNVALVPLQVELKVCKTNATIKEIQLMPYR